MSIPELLVMFYAWPGPGVRCGFKRSTEREHAAQPHCCPEWADLVESVDLVFQSACTNALHSHLIQVDCKLVFPFEVVTP